VGQGTMTTIRLPGVMKHPKTGMLWLRRVVPPHLRQWVGQREFRLSLGTKDIAQAKARYHEVAAQVQRRLDYAQQLHEADREIARELGEQGEHHQRVEEWLDKLMPEQRELVEQISWHRSHDVQLSLDHHEEIVLRTLPKWALRFDKAPWEPFDEEPAGPPTDQPAVTRADRPDVGRQDNGTRHADPARVTLRQLMTFWANDTQAAVRTRYTWGLTIDRFGDWLGHDDAARVTKGDVIRYKDHLLASGRKPKTVQQHVNIIKTVYSNALNNERLPGVTVNPAQGVRVVAKGSQLEERRGYTEPEALAALRAVEGHPDPAMRFLPPLMLWTGARLEDACGIRCRDVRQVKGAGWCVDFVPHADRTFKTGSKASRTVPLHDELWAFIDFAKERQANAKDPDELLFNTLSRDRHDKLAPNATKRLSGLIRPVVPDPNVAPSHSWRHTAITRLRAIGCPEDLRKEITGHSADGVHGRYGSATPPAILRQWIDKLPALT
jgi:integrase